ncbi:hypothetical protein PTSG_04540 [Salpingoeca rosetta]|uniref:RNA 3'-terminal phosphate cyclase-like protein n=1 Tax=Salpingoeca rosetta (strain ATCC 50818 / BSB-021) TaxID=946362 RepID=F2U7Q8_SALR5|nr:uncharacterized protein PTSG_04540 [Salpingoeca rosetta]EGD72813.1 hypothetical protein PTSG_04540 [Salpingoeca rosetta]|eukprot:XP_004994636.1 hypothetical protein PTSG_04540 [Salpingoeca rosetta]
MPPPSAAALVKKPKPIVYESSNYFRQRIVLSLLSGRPCRFNNIRSEHANPGVRGHEVKFLRLMEKITDGTKITINDTGTQVTFRPGNIVNGRKLTFNCGTARSIGYYLEHLLYVAPFGKKPLHITFTGITNDDQDPNVDILRTTMLPVLQRFGLDDGLELKILKRGCRGSGRDDSKDDKQSAGGGEIVFQCPIFRQVTPLRALLPGKVKRVRGIVYTALTASHTSNRVVDGARSVLNNFIPNVFLYTEHFGKDKGGKAPGYGVSLIAETTQGYLFSAQATAQPRQQPEELGKQCSRLLLEEIKRSGTTDRQCQCVTFALMALCSQDVSKVCVGELTDYSVQFLRDLKKVFGVTFKLRRDPETNLIYASCVGVGYKNVNRKIT